MNIQVSNLNLAVDNEGLKDLFAPYGTIKSAEVIKDVFRGTSIGFGFVEIEDNTAAQQAVAALHNTVFENLTISVEEAPPKTTHRGSYKVGNGIVEVYRFNKKR